MKRYKIAELIVDMQVKYPTLLKQGEAYLCPASSAEKADMTIVFTDEELEEKHRRTPVFDLNSCEYMYTGGAFYNRLLNFNGMMLHSSCVAYEGKAYMFSGPCGTGKSTHTGLWRKYFGEENTFIVNDDKPCIREFDGRYYVYGTPWSGKTDQNLNVKLPLEAVVFLAQAGENKAYVMNDLDCVKNIMEQTVRPRDPVKMAALLGFIDKLVKNVPIYRLECLPNTEAVECIYSYIKENKEKK